MKHFSFAEHRLCHFEAQPKVDSPQVAEAKVETQDISQKIQAILKLNGECEAIVATIPPDPTKVREQYAKRLEAAKEHCLAAQLQTSAESMATLDSFLQELQGHKEVLQAWEMRKKGVVAEKSEQQLYTNDPNGKLTSYTVEFTDGWTLEKWEPGLPIRYKLYDTVIGTGKYGNTWSVHLQEGDSITVTARKGNETKTIVVKAQERVTASPQSETNTSKDAVATTPPPAAKKEVPTPAAKEMKVAEKPAPEKAAPAEQPIQAKGEPAKNMNESFQVAMNDTLKKINEDPYIKGMQPSMPADTPGPSPTINTDTRKVVRNPQSTVTPEASPASQKPLPVLSAMPDVSLPVDNSASPATINPSMDDAPSTIAGLTPEELARQKAEKEEKDRTVNALKLPENPFAVSSEKEIGRLFDLLDTHNPDKNELARLVTIINANPNNFDIRNPGLKVVYDNLKKYGERIYNTVTLTFDAATNKLDIKDTPATDEPAGERTNNVFSNAAEAVPLTQKQQEVRDALDGTNQTIREAMEALRVEDAIFDRSAIDSLIDASNKKLATLIRLDATPLTTDGTLKGYLEAFEKKYFRPGTIQRLYIGDDRTKNALYFGDTATEQDASKPETTPADTLNGLIGKGEYAQAIREFVEKPIQAKNLDAALDASKQLRSKINEVIIANEDNAKRKAAKQMEEVLDKLDWQIIEEKTSTSPDPEKPAADETETDENKKRLTAIQNNFQKLETGMNGKKIVVDYTNATTVDELKKIESLSNNLNAIFSALDADYGLSRDLFNCTINGTFDSKQNVADPNKQTLFINYNDSMDDIIKYLDVQSNALLDIKK